jgi:hypothetical protein
VNLIPTGIHARPWIETDLTRCLYLIVPLQVFRDLIMPHPAPPADCVFT